MDPPKSIFITATDTDVGKTVVTAAVASCIKSSGRKVSAMKPIQTGTNAQKVLDIEFVYRVLGEDYSIDDVCPYRFAEPLSPKLASEISGAEINIKVIISAFRKLHEKFEHIIVEGAGGIMAPIKKNYFMSDLILDLDIPLIIVARPGLGTINHTLLTIEYAKHRGLNLLGVIINKYPVLPGHAEITNPNEISVLSGLPILGIIPDIRKSDIYSTDQMKFLRENSCNYLCELLGGNYSFNAISKSLNLISK